MCYNHELKKLEKYPAAETEHKRMVGGGGCTSLLDCVILFAFG